jgi:predicted transcriptional regulator
LRLLSFEEQFASFVENQKKLGSPRRLEMLERDLSGTMRMFKEILWPVFQTFDGFVLEYELTGPGGVKIFVDVMYVPLGLAFECEGFSVHAETITRERFTFEKSRVRTMLLSNCVYVPFTRDELDKRGQHCRSYVHELLNKYRNTDVMLKTLTIYEREVLRHAVWLQRPVKMADMCLVLGKKRDFAYKVINSLMEKGLLKPSKSTPNRHFSYVVDVRAVEYIRKI